MLDGPGLPAGALRAPSRASRCIESRAAGACRAAVVAAAARRRRPAAAARRGACSLACRPCAGEIARLLARRSDGEVAARRSAAGGRRHRGAGAQPCAGRGDAAGAGGGGRGQRRAVAGQRLRQRRRGRPGAAAGRDAGAAARAAAARRAGHRGDGPRRRGAAGAGRPTRPALLDCMARFAAYRDSWLTARRRPHAARMDARRRRQPPPAAPARRRAPPDQPAAPGRVLHEAAASHAGARGAAALAARAAQPTTRRDDATQLRLESDRNLVQVVTIHKSKGLEYPLVFCPLLWDGHARGDSQRRRPGVPRRRASRWSTSATLDKEQLEADQGAAGAGTRRRDAAPDLRGADARGAPLHLVVGPYLSRHGKHAAARPQSSRAPAQLAGGRRRPVAAQLAAEQADAGSRSMRPGPRWRSAHAPQVGAGAAAARPARCVLRRRHAAAQRLAALRLPRPHAGRRGGSAATAAWRMARATKARPSTMTCARAGRAADGACRAARMDADDILRFPRGAGGRRVPACGVRAHRLHRCRPAGPRRSTAALQRFAPALPARRPAARCWPRMLLRMLHDVLHTPLPGGMRLARGAAPRASWSNWSSTCRRATWTRPRWCACCAEHGLGRAGAAVRHARAATCAASSTWCSSTTAATTCSTGSPTTWATAPRTMPAPRCNARWRSTATTCRPCCTRWRCTATCGSGCRTTATSEHFGGVLYLFVRGVRPGWTLADGTAAGVHAQRPTLQLLDAAVGAVRR